MNRQISIFFHAGSICKVRLNKAELSVCSLFIQFEMIIKKGRFYSRRLTAVVPAGKEG